MYLRYDKKVFPLYISQKKKKKKKKTISISTVSYLFVSNVFPWLATPMSTIKRIWVILWLRRVRK